MTFYEVGIAIQLNTVGVVTYMLDGFRQPRRSSDLCNVCLGRSKVT